MARSPNYGKVRRPRPLRTLFVTNYHEFRGGHCDGLILVTLQEPGRAPISFPARDQGHAVCLADLLKQGMFDRQMAAARG